MFGPAVSIGWLLVALIAWCRVRLGDHTIAQVHAGVIVAGAAATLVFAASA